MRGRGRETPGRHSGRGGPLRRGVQLACREVASLRGDEMTDDMRDQLHDPVVARKRHLGDLAMMLTDEGEVLDQGAEVFPARKVLRVDHHAVQVAVHAYEAVHRLGQLAEVVLGQFGFRLNEEESAADVESVLQHFWASSGLPAVPQTGSALRLCNIDGPVETAAGRKKGGKPKPAAPFHRPVPIDQCRSTGSDGRNRRQSKLMPKATP